MEPILLIDRRDCCLLRQSVTAKTRNFRSLVSPRSNPSIASGSSHASHSLSVIATPSNPSSPASSVGVFSLLVQHVARAHPRQITGQGGRPAGFPGENESTPGRKLGVPFHFTSGPRGTRGQETRCHRAPNAANERLARHLWNHRDDLFTFLRQPGLDATNWRAELAIRFGVILRKVWGGSRTWAGARAQSVLMSVWRTCWQQGRSALDFLSHLLRGIPMALALPP